MTLENIIDTANALGWTVTEESSFKHSPRTITFSQMREKISDLTSTRMTIMKFPRRSGIMPMTLT